MSAINRGDIPRLLLPHLHAIAWNIDAYHDLYKNIFTTFTSDKAVEYELIMADLGPAQQKAEGAPFASGQMQELWQASYPANTYGTMFTMTGEAIQDNLYPDQFPMQATMFKNALSATRNLVTMAVINNGFVFNTGNADGQPLFSLNHPTANGVLANTFPNKVDLNEASLEDAITAIKLWTSYSGIKQNISPFKLYGPPALQYQMSRLLNGRERTGTANREISAIVHDEYIPGGFTVNPYIDNPAQWGIVTDVEHGFKFFQRHKPTVDFMTDQTTNNVTARMYERYGVGFTDFKCSWGAIGL
jgi:hypothetical protein